MQQQPSNRPLPSEFTSCKSEPELIASPLNHVQSGGFHISGTSTIFHSLSQISPEHPRSLLTPNLFKESPVLGCSDSSTFLEAVGFTSPHHYFHHHPTDLSAPSLFLYLIPYFYLHMAARGNILKIMSSHTAPFSRKNNP